MTQTPTQVRRPARLLPALALALGLGLLAAPGHALAGTALCMWKAMPDTQRTAFLNAYATGGYQAAGGVFTSDELGNSAKACNVSDADNNTAIAKLAAYSLRQAAANNLQLKKGVDPKKLAAAWKAVPADTRTAFAAATAAGHQRTPEEQDMVTKTVAGICAKLGLDATDTPTATDVVLFILGDIMSGES
ncbi:MAG: hypothetical protein JWP35_2222 [Caulobacter sp.]|nr:hypothetical protein [Caulobacter sp.]